jgi:hypothetical protein
MTIPRRSILLAAVAAAACSSSPSGRGAAVPPPVSPSDSLFARLGQQVTNGSILGDAQLGRIPPMAVGACLNPVTAASVELDRMLDLAPDAAPMVVGAFILPALPEYLREKEERSGMVVARWVVDTNGVAEPGSASILSSPHGLLSVRVCGAIFMAHFTPARDDGRKVRARVEMPVRVVP